MVFCSSCNPQLKQNQIFCEVSDSSVLYRKNSKINLKREDNQHICYSCFKIPQETGVSETRAAYNQTLISVHKLPQEARDNLINFNLHDKKE